MTDPTTPGADLDALRARHSAWRIEYIWTARSSGPDARQIVARREGVEVRAWDAAGLSAQIAACETAHGWG
jgi:hypothetical protein